MTEGPIIGAELWAEVLRRCGSRCACTGQCGKPHKKDGGRCPHENMPGAPLHAIPREDTAAIAAMLLPAGSLMTACDDCDRGILAARRKAARAEVAEALSAAPGLF